MFNVGDKIKRIKPPDKWDSSPWKNTTHCIFRGQSETASYCYVLEFPERPPYSYGGGGQNGWYNVDKGTMKQYELYIPVNLFYKHLLRKLYVK